MLILRSLLFFATLVVPLSDWLMANVIGAEGSDPFKSGSLFSQWALVEVYA